MTRYHHDHSSLNHHNNDLGSNNTIETHNVSRRGFLKGSFGLLVATWFSKISETVIHALPTAPKRIFLAPDDHTDYFWSADDVTYQQKFLEMLDYYLNQADATATNPSAFQSRWNCDGSFWVWVYERNRTFNQFQRLIARIRDGHISMPLNALCVCLGGAPAEAVLRGMYYPGQIERRYGLRFYLAYSMENQTLPLGLGALWAGAGAKYSWKGICNCATKVPSAWDRQYDIYWWTGLDGSRILIKWNSMLYGNQSIGGYAEAYSPSVVVDQVTQNADFIARYSYTIIGAFGQGWDNLATMDQQCVITAQNKTDSTRQILVSNEVDFFQEIEATQGANLPTLSCSFGNEWELDCAIMAEVSARVKRAVEKLRSAEALATLVSLQSPSFMNGRETARNQAWMNLGLFWEHDWPGPGGDLSTKRIAWARKITGEIENYVDALYGDATTTLGSLIQKSGSNLRFFVFNPLSWVRTDIADFLYSGSTSVRVVDLSTNTETPSQIVNINGQQFLRILAQNIPSVGYKVFEVQTGTTQFTGGPVADASTGIIENEFYQITVAGRGAITNLLDKTRSNREFASTINNRVINDLGFAPGTLAIENAGPVSITLLANSTAPLAHTTRITLFRGSSRIDIRNDITQNFDATFTWGFGFNLSAPDVQHEEVGAIIRAKLLSQGGHYSDRSQNSRYDWLTLNHFADMTGSGPFGVTLSNSDCYYMRLGNSTVSSLDVNTPQISPLVGGHDPNGSTGILNQGGDSHFLQRFALQTHDAYDPVSAMKFALEHQNPLVTGVVTGGKVYPETFSSLLTISNPNVLLWALKPADDGILSQGIIARVWNLTNSPASFDLVLSPDPIVNAQYTTHIETPLASVPVNNGILSDTLTAQQIKTFSLMPASVDAMRKKRYLPFIRRSVS